MWQPVRPDVRWPELERDVLRLWREQRIFERALEARRDGEPFVFYEGPPTANGLPHAGSVLTRVMKDVFLRYQTMLGRYVPRRAGWDTHGLPVEVEVEKELGIHGRAGIERYGVEAFTRRCMDSVFRYIDAWRSMSERIGFWMDFDQPYVTFHESYVESVWWSLAQLFERGLLYQDYKVVWWWPQGGTALSAGEVGLGYRTVDDPSVFVRFPVHGAPRTSLLAWTTTPWTLPSHVALAVHPDASYVTVELDDGERLILAEARLEPTLGGRPHRVVEHRTGRELCNLSYDPPFRYAEPEGGRAFVVVDAAFVALDSGTGIVHVAPAFGEDDFRLRRERGLGFLQLLEPDGRFPAVVRDFAGRFCKEADRDILRSLRARGLLFREETYRHEYPFCWRAPSDPLIQYARRSWFIRTTALVDRMIANHETIRWQPEHVRDGRMGMFLRSNVDWALSRERFWGTPLPIWVNDETGRMEAIGSVAELLARNERAFDGFEEARRADPTLSPHLRVHKPWIDAVEYRKPGEPGVYRRVPDVIDCWYDSGAMPFAQHGWPHRNVDAFERQFPAHFITEAIDQTRGWFYSLLAISTLLFPDRPGPHPFRSCLVLGHVTDERGHKQSKSRGNYTDPMLLIEQHGADAFRWSLYTHGAPGQNIRFTNEAPVEALRGFLLKVWNVHAFLTTYAAIDRWDPRATRPALPERHVLDRWILAELDDTVRAVRASLDGLDPQQAALRLEAFVDA
ncbi:MAG: isoleucine--tRNA ligase, partial [Myxococcales bacterium]|nr:isoleucine--tRNA ligase [Myxococcales bacterium]